MVIGPGLKCDQNSSLPVGSEVQSSSVVRSLVYQCGQNPSLILGSEAQSPIVVKSPVHQCSVVRRLVSQCVEKASLPVWSEAQFPQCGQINLAGTLLTQLLWHTDFIHNYFICCTQFLLLCFYRFCMCPTKRKSCLVLIDKYADCIL